MASNRVACVHITHENVRLMEGRVGNGVIMITNTAIVEKASRFFSGERLAYMQELVAAIVSAMNVNSFSAKDIHIVYDNHVQVDFFLDERLHGGSDRKKLLMNIGGKKDAEADDLAKRGSTGVVVHKTKWGKYITEVDQGELTTTTHIERDLVDFMVSEFHEHGYKVKSIEAPETALLYYRNVVKYTYDALNKLVVYANNNEIGTFYQFTKDAPVGNKQFHFDSVRSTNFTDCVVGCVQEEIRKSGLHSPHVMLVGDAFADQQVYLDTCEALKESGIVCLDTYALWHDRGAPVNSIHVVANEDYAEIERDGRYGICMALMFRTLEKKPENMIEGIHFSVLGKRQRRALADFALTLAILVAIYGVGSAAISYAEMSIVNKEYRAASASVDLQLTAIESDRDRVREQYSTLATIDTRLNKVFRFVYNQSALDLNVASVDTIDMLPYSSASPVAAEETAENAEEAPQTYVSQPSAEAQEKAAGPQIIIIRGYSSTTDAPVRLYQALVSENLGKAELVGVEQVSTSTSDELYAFELWLYPN